MGFGFGLGWRLRGKSVLACDATASIAGCIGGGGGGADANQLQFTRTGPVLVFHNAHPLVAFPDLTLSLMSYALRSYAVRQTLFFGRSWEYLTSCCHVSLMRSVIIQSTHTGLAFNQPFLFVLSRIRITSLSSNLDSRCKSQMGQWGNQMMLMGFTLTNMSCRMTCLDDHSNESSWLWFY